MPNPKDVFDNPLQYLDFLQSTRFEGQHFDRKEIRINNNNQINTLKDKIRECISAFANSNREGGLLALGIADDGIIKGTQHVDEQTMNNILQTRLSLINHSTITRCVDLEDSIGNHLYLLYTPWKEDAICETIGNFPKAWRRDGAQNFPLTDQDREQLKQDKRIVDFETRYCCSYDPDELDKNIVEEFKKTYLEARNAQYDDYTTESILHQVGALTKENDGYTFTNAGYLFFASNPRKRIPSAFVRILRYDAPAEDLENLAETLVDKDFEGPLLNIIRNLQNFLKDAILFQTLGEPEYPLIAVDEAFVNAIIHRDYAAPTPVRCITYKDKLVVINPGGILQRVPQHFSLANINLESVPRNPKLVEWMRMIKDEQGENYVRSLSEGTRRMREEMEHIGLPAPDYETNNNTTVTLHNNVSNRPQKHPINTVPKGQEPVMTPNGWVQTTLSELITLESGLRPRGGVKGITEGIPSLGGEHLNDKGGFRSENMKYIPEEFFKSLNYGHICQSDVLVVKDGATTGKTSFVDEDFPYTQAAINEHLFIVRSIQELVTPKFVFYYLFSREGQDSIRLDFRGATIGGISRNFPEKVEIPLPPLAEQYRIVANLDMLFAQLDTAVDSLKKAQAQLQRYRQSILNAAFEGELTRKWRDRREEKTGKDIEKCVDTGWIERKGATINKRTSPEHWEVVLLKETANLRREKVQPKDSSENLNFVGLKHIDSGVSILKRWGDASEVKSTKSRFYPNDVLYGKLRSYLDKAVIAEMEGICSADILVFTTNSKMIPRFLVYFLHNQTFRNYAIATSSGITLPRTSWSALGEFTFALPPLAEQEQIVSELERCFSIADEVESTIASELTRVERLRQSILKHAFSGKLVPQDPNDEPISVLLKKIRHEKQDQQMKRKKITTKSKTASFTKQLSFPIS